MDPVSEWRNDPHEWQEKVRARLWNAWWDQMLSLDDLVAWLQRNHSQDVPVDAESAKRVVKRWIYEAGVYESLGYIPLGDEILEDAEAEQTWLRLAQTWDVISALDIQEEADWFTSQGFSSTGNPLETIPTAGDVSMEPDAGAAPEEIPWPGITPVEYPPSISLPVGYPPPPPMSFPPPVRNNTSDATGSQTMGEELLREAWWRLVKLTPGDAAEMAVGLARLAAHPETEVATDPEWWKSLVRALGWMGTPGQWLPDLLALGRLAAENRLPLPGDEAALTRPQKPLVAAALARVTDIDEIARGLRLNRATVVERLRTLGEVLRLRQRGEDLLRVLPERFPEPLLGVTWPPSRKRDRESSQQWQKSSRLKKELNTTKVRVELNKTEWYLIAATNAGVFNLSEIAEALDMTRNTLIQCLRRLRVKIKSSKSGEEVLRDLPQFADQLPTGMTWPPS